MRLAILPIILSLLSYVPVFAQSTIVQGEFFVDEYVDFGKGQRIEVSPGETIHVSASISLSSLTPGLHKLYVRFKSSEGVWSHTHSRLLFQPDYSTTPTAVGFEYFFDEYVDVGKGTFVTLVEDSTAYPLSAQDMEPGVHLLYTRTKSSTDVWSLVSKRLFYVPDSTESMNIVRIEYYYTDTLNNSPTERYIFDNFEPAPAIAFNEEGFAANGSALRVGETYLLHVQAFTDAEEATAERTFTFTVPFISLQVDTTNVTCAGDTNGEVTVTASGGSGEFMYSISTDSANYIAKNVFENLAAGDYKAYANDGDTVVSKAFTIQAPPELQLILTGEVTPYSCEDPQGGSFTVVASGGAGTGFKYSLDGTTFQENSTFSGLEADNYTVTVRDANSCIDMLDVEVTFSGNRPETPVIKAETNATTDSLSTEVILLVENVSGSFQWYLDGELIEGATTNQIDLTSAGPYTVLVTNDDDCASAMSEPFQVTSIEDKFDQAVRVYPNPVEEELTIALPKAITASETTQVALYDLQGRELIRRPVRQYSNTTLDTQSLEPGVYLLRVQSREFVLQKKVQKQ
ncbi:MAG: T9SS type A sorting domain-containing protein [Cyclobacteriaceae bacterium]|jgi:hypothetical protein